MGQNTAYAKGGNIYDDDEIPLLSLGYNTRVFGHHELFLNNINTSRRVFDGYCTLYLSLGDQSEQGQTVLFTVTKSNVTNAFSTSSQSESNADLIAYKSHQGLTTLLQ